VTSPKNQEPCQLFAPTLTVSIPLLIMRAADNSISRLFFTMKDPNPYE
jgi:hypothetical protein